MLALLGGQNCHEDSVKNIITGMIYMCARAWSGCEERLDSFITGVGYTILGGRGVIEVLLYDTYCLVFCATVLQ